MQTSCLFHAIKKRIVNKWPASQLLLEYSYFLVHFLVSLQHCLVASLHSFLAFLQHCWVASLHSFLASLQHCLASLLHCLVASLHSFLASLQHV